MQYWNVVHLTEPLLVHSRAAANICTHFVQTDLNQRLIELAERQQEAAEAANAAEQDRASAEAAIAAAQVRPCASRSEILLFWLQLLCSMVVTCCDCKIASWAWNGMQALIPWFQMLVSRPCRDNCLAQSDARCC